MKKSHLKAIEIFKKVVFCNRHRLDTAPSEFMVVVNRLQTFFYPLIYQKDSPPIQWLPDKGWQGS
ncbi:MAG: hypothetical protein AB1457_14810 [Chloroflexota bacterium]|nr:MAG: hypothetical protein KatS3mg045_0160 [Bellilinea sp.]